MYTYFSIPVCISTARTVFVVRVKTSTSSTGKPLAKLLESTSKYLQPAAEHMYRTYTQAYYYYKLFCMAIKQWLSLINTCSFVSRPWPLTHKMACLVSLAITVTNFRFCLPGLLFENYYHWIPKSKQLETTAACEFLQNGCHSCHPAQQCKSTSFRATPCNVYEYYTSHWYVQSKT